MDAFKPEELAEQVKRLGIDQIERHIFICAEPEKAKCCSEKEGAKVWSALKKGLAKRGVENVYRTRANCLRVCEQGPIAVVYPEGTWYHHLDEDAIERVIDEHLVGGRPVEELVFRRQPLKNAE